ncbi:MAG TPA: hypothetical protein VED84_02410 [Acidimicrobiales bacterium]|nr:hypothetical protein [Acidimicrobiales bacterium]
MFDETCHCTAGVGLPEAAALKVAVEPEATVSLDGWPVMAGATAGGLGFTGAVDAGCTLRVATFVVAELTVLVKTARY